jgi:hypothetical protein
VWNAVYGSMSGNEPPRVAVSRTEPLDQKYDALGVQIDSICYFPSYACFSGLVAADDNFTNII